MSTLNVKKEESWKMFDRIAGRYDRINGILSFGIHHHWRAQLAAHLTSRRNLHVVDLATGTGDVPIVLAKNPNVARITGLDLSKNMIQLGRKKIARKNLENKITLSHGDAVTIPLEDNCADMVTVVFGIRNFSHPEKSLQNIYRILRPWRQSPHFGVFHPPKPILENTLPVLASLPSSLSRTPTFPTSRSLSLSQPDDRGISLRNPFY